MANAEKAIRRKSMPLLLLIEDDRDALVSSGHLLRTCGFDVEIARGGDDGIAKALSLRPDIIVTDLLMPPTGGVEVCVQLRAFRKTQRIPIIVYTGVTDIAVLSGLCRLGVRLFAIKPCVPTVIGHEARALMDGAVPIGDVRVVTGYGETLDAFAEAVLAASAAED
jgi:twitching motility two-component system response regulator PilH